jgi:hypothetical protein
MLFSRSPARRALLVALAFATIAPSAHAATFAAPQPALTPSDDVFTSAKNVRHSYGGLSRLVLSRKPASRAFMRFNLGAAPGPGFHAVLYVYSFSDSAKGLRMRHASDTGWDERHLTGAKLPRTGPRSLNTGALRRNHWKGIDVTHLVNSSGVVSLALAPRGNVRVTLASREAGEFAPRLAFGYGARPSIDAVPALGGGNSSTPAGSRPAGGASAAGTPGDGTVSPPHVEPSSTNPCGVASTAPAWKHVVWIVMENHADYQVMGSASAPYINHLASQCGYASQYYGITHPSLPNYIAMTSGSTQGVTDDGAPSSHPLNVPSIFSQLGSDWKSLQEGMAGNCQKSNGGNYAVKHNPAAYYTNIAANCAAQDIPLGAQPDVSAKFTFITPDMCSDMHDCPVNAGDTWLSTWVPRILDSPEYKGGDTAVFITFDEDDMTQTNRVATLVLSPSTAAGLTDASRFDHYSLLRTTEEMLGLPPVLGGAATAASMRGAFNL